MESRFTWPPMSMTCTFPQRASSFTTVIEFVNTSRRTSGISEASMVVLLPESMKIAVPGRMSWAAFWAIAYLAGALRVMRRANRSSVPTVKLIDFAPPCTRTMRRASSSTLRSVRRVISLTSGNDCLSRANPMLPSAFTSSTILFRRSSMVMVRGLPLKKRGRVCEHPPPMRSRIYSTTSWQAGSARLRETTGRCSPRRCRRGRRSADPRRRDRAASRAPRAASRCACR